MNDIIVLVVHMHNIKIGGVKMQIYTVERLRHYCNISVPGCSAIRRIKIDYYDFTAVLSGSMTYIADGKLYTLNKNDGVLLPPGTLRERLPGTEPVRYISFNFYLNPKSRLMLPLFLPSCITDDIRRLISAFPQSHLSGHDSAREKAASLLNFILCELRDTAAAESANPHVLRITRYINAHITKPLTLKSISAEVGLTREYISALFRKETGKTLTDYINERKLLFARQLLQSGEMSLADIAGHVGYENYGYFSRLFKRYFGISPTDMKNQN